MSETGITEEFMRDRAIALMPDIHRRGRRRRRARLALTSCGAIAVLAVALPLTLRSTHGSQTVNVGPVSPLTTTARSIQPDDQPNGAVTAAQLAGGHWTVIPGAPIVPRSDASQVWTGQELIVWGGDNFSSTSDRVYNDGAAYNPTSGQWHVMATAPIAGRYRNVAVWTGTELIEWGGYSSNDTPLLDGAAYNPTANSWTKLPSSPFSQGQQLSSGPIGIWTGEQLIVLSDSVTGDRTKAETASFSPASRRWQTFPVPADPYGQPIDWVAAAQSGHDLIAWSQWQTHTSIPPNGVETRTGTDVFAYDETTRQWKSRGASQYLIASTVSAGNLVYTIDNPYAPGSSGPPEPVTAGQFDPSSNSSTQLPNSPLAWGSPSFTWTGAALLSVAKSGATTVSPGTVATYDPAKTTWSEISVPNLGCATTGEVPTWTGSQVIFYNSAANSSGQPAKSCGLTLTPASPSSTAGSSPSPTWNPYAKPGPPYASYSLLERTISLPDADVTLTPAPQTVRPKTAPPTVSSICSRVPCPFYSQSNPVIQFGLLTDTTRPSSDADTPVWIITWSHTSCFSSFPVRVGSTSTVPAVSTTIPIYQSTCTGRVFIEASNLQYIEGIGTGG